jgi:hypothetical protein
MDLMDQRAAGQPGATASGARPAVLADLTAIQMDELDSQFADGDRAGWTQLAESYGRTPVQAQAVWAWFAQRPTAG